MTNEDRVKAVASHGFTIRQAAFLTTVMLHAGVCVQRQFRTFAAIAQGQVVRDFFDRLVARRFATAHAFGPRGAHLFHVHHKLLYRAIGEPDSRYRRRGSLTRAVERLMVLDAVLSMPQVKWLATERDKVAYFVHQRGLDTADLPALTFEARDSRTTRYFPDKVPLGLAPLSDQVTLLCVVTEPTGRLFRTFLEHHERLVRRLNRWRVVLVLPTGLTNAEAAHRAVFNDLCAPPLRPTVLDELRWYCSVRRALEEGATHPPDQARYARARRAFGAPRFYATFRRWCRDGEIGLQPLLSPLLCDARQRGAVALETWVLPYVYGELGPLAKGA